MNIVSHRPNRRLLPIFAYAINKPHGPALFNAINRERNLGIGWAVLDWRTQDNEARPKVRYIQDMTVQKQVHAHVGGVANVLSIRECIQELCT